MRSEAIVRAVRAAEVDLMKEADEWRRDGFPNAAKRADDARISLIALGKALIAEAAAEERRDAAGDEPSGWGERG